MSEHFGRRVLLPVALTLGCLLIAVCVLDAVVPDPPGSLRHHSLRNRVECILEKWGIIEFDPFRHIEG